MNGNSNRKQCITPSNASQQKTFSVFRCSPKVTWIGKKGLLKFSQSKISKEKKQATNAFTAPLGAAPFGAGLKIQIQKA